LKKYCCIFILLVFAALAFGQTNDTKMYQLAQEYNRKGEYEKALPLYEKLYSKNSRNTFYFQNYINTLMALDRYDDAEKASKKQIKKLPKDLGYRVSLGQVYLKQNMDKKAIGEFEDAIDLIGADVNQMVRLANSFQTAGLEKYAILAYEKGQKASGDKTGRFLLNIATLYLRQPNLSKGIDAYLEYLSLNPKQLQIVKNYLGRSIKDDEQKEELQSQLYRRIQKNDNNVNFIELLAWSFVQQKDFESAFTQMKALDKRLDEDGSRVMSLANQAIQEKEFNAAIYAYEYVLDKGQANSNYLPAYQGVLNARRLKLTSNLSYAKEDVLALETDYNSFLEEFGRNASTIMAMKQLSHLQAFYLFEEDRAIATLEEIVSIPNVNQLFKAECKLDLGDFYLLTGEVWESTLLYSQVDKDYKDGALGEDARFRNAKLSYYLGDFDWAQTQLTVLKASTSELIANDALDLSIFITDNLGLDTTAIPMQMYARSDLKIFQNKTQEAFQTLDSINTIFPGHALADDILFAKARISIKEQKFDEAAAFLEQMIASYPSDILTDNALFMLGELYETELDDKSKAYNYYETIILDHSGSIFTTEARKRYRNLRGDQL